MVCFKNELFIYDPSKGFNVILRKKFKQIKLNSFTEFDSFDFNLDRDFQYAIILVLELEDLIILEWILNREVKNIFLLTSLNIRSEFYNFNGNLLIFDFHILKGDLLKEISFFLSNF